MPVENSPGAAAERDRPRPHVAVGQQQVAVAVVRPLQPQDFTLADRQLTLSERKRCPPLRRYRLMPRHGLEPSGRMPICSASLLMTGEDRRGSVYGDWCQNLAPANALVHLRWQRPYSFSVCCRSRKFAQHRVCPNLRLRVHMTPTQAKSYLLDRRLYSTTASGFTLC